MQSLPSKQYWFDMLSESIYDRHIADFWLKKINPLWSTQQCLGKIVSKTNVAHDMLALKIRCNQHMQYGIAGQHHPIRVDIAGRRYERNYSLTRLDAQHVQICVKKVPDGVMSQWLCEQSKIGDLIEFLAPFGEMTLAQKPQQLVLVAAGSGITPMYSMLHELAKTGQLAQRSVRLLYWAKRQRDFAFLSEFAQWQEQYPSFVVELLSTQEAPFAARVNPEHAQRIPQLAEQQVYICGPSGFVNAATAAFAQAKILKSEAFSFSPVPTDEQDLGHIEVTLTRSNQTIMIPKGQPILVGLEQANLKPTHGCRMGICNKCACKKNQGQTKNLNDGSVNNEPNQDLRICVNTAQTALILDL
jgi:ferredoxin-NADP reductase